MLQSTKMSRAGLPETTGFPRTLSVRLAVAVLAGSLLSGCAYFKRDHVEVGAIPDDYRTNHPIVISERQQVVDIPVGVTDEAVTKAQHAAITGFLDFYEPSSGAVVQVLLPVGSANERAVANLSPEIFAVMTDAGVPRHKIFAVPYQANAPESAAPVRLAYTKMTASTNDCGRWPDDILENSENKHYANFGCSYQNNLAAQIANPADLLGPRKPSEIDAERRVIAIGEYREGGQAVREDTSYTNP